MSFPLTVNGTPTFGAAKFGNGLTVLSETDYLSAPTSPFAFPAGVPWTVEMWMTIPTTTAIKIMLSLGGGAWFGVAGGDFAISLPSLSGGSAQGSGLAVANGAWHHVVAQFDGTSKISLYVDGVRGTVLTTAYTQPSGASAVGKFTSSGGYAWPGNIDELAIWQGEKYGASYTPPTGAYTGMEPNLYALYHFQADGTDSAIASPLSAGAITANALTSTTIKPQLDTIYGGTGPYSTVFSYSTTTNGTYTQIGTAVTGTNPVATAFATGLSALTTYYFRAVVTDSAGTPAVLTLPSTTTGTPIQTATGVAPTTFALPGSDAVGGLTRYSGYYAFETVATVACIHYIGYYGQMDTKITVANGTNTVKLRVYGNGQNINVFDNGTLVGTVNTGSGSAWNVVTFLTNLTVGAHNITLSGVGDNMYFDLAYGWNVTDNAPTQAAPDNFGTRYPVQSAPFNANSRIEGGFYAQALLGYPSLLTCYHTDGTIKFPVSAGVTAIRAFMPRCAMTYVVYKGTTQIQGPTTISNTVPRLVTLISGLDGSAAEYEIRGINGTNESWIIQEFMLVGGTLGTQSYAPRDIYVEEGDSITQTINGDSRIGYVYKMGAANNVAVVNGGVQSDSSAALLARIGQITALPADSIKAWTVMIGVNDVLQGIPVSTYQANVTSIMNAMNARFPSARGYFIKILPASGSHNSIIPNYNAVLPTVAASGTNVSVIDITTGPGGTFNTTTDVGDSTSHPNAAGYDKLAPNLAALIIPSTTPATAYTFTGPASIVVGVPTTYTATPNGPYSAAVNVGKTGSGTGTLTPTGQSWTGDAAAKTFTLTATGAGTIILTPTNTGGLTNPAALSITATSTPPVGTAFTLTLSASSGLVGAPVTLTYQQNGTGTKVATPSMSGLAGTFSPPTVTMSGTAPVTQTFTPSADGTGSLTATAPGLTAPGALSYVSNPSGGGETVGVGIAYHLRGTGTSWSGQPFTLVGGGAAVLTTQVVISPTEAFIYISGNGNRGSYTVSDGVDDEIILPAVGPNLIYVSVGPGGIA